MASLRNHVTSALPVPFSAVGPDTCLLQGRRSETRLRFEPGALPTFDDLYRVLEPPYRRRIAGGFNESDRALILGPIDPAGK